MGSLIRIGALMDDVNAAIYVEKISAQELAQRFTNNLISHVDNCEHTTADFAEGSSRGVHHLHYYVGTGPRRSQKSVSASFLGGTTLRNVPYVLSLVEFEDRAGAVWSAAEKEAISAALYR